MIHPSKCPLARHFRIVVVFLAALCSPALAEGTAAVKGKVIDAEGLAADGARVFVYDTADVRRPANFISAPAGANGLFRIVLSPGRYWLLARLKKTEGYGPLMPGDKHSGEPVEIELSAGQEIERDFTVADLKDARKIKSKDREGPIKISGRIVDEKGSPVIKSYAIAFKKQKSADMPDYFSAWVDSHGRYTLYLPAGTYSLGSAMTFPPQQKDFMKLITVTVNAESSEVHIVRPLLEIKK